MIGFQSIFSLKLKKANNKFYLSRKLQYYQQKTKVVLSQNQTLSEMADKVNLKNMYTLSEHLIHIMDHLYELHQLNKHHLRTIIE